MIMHVCADDAAHQQTVQFLILCAVVFQLGFNVCGVGLAAYVCAVDESEAGVAFVDE